MDRNYWGDRAPDCCCVALRKESVDRNSTASASIRVCITVALRKESVDRNSKNGRHYIGCKMSLSARRAWIEMRG